MEDKYLKQLLGNEEQPIMITRQHWVFLLGELSPELALIVLILAGISASWITWAAAAWLAFGYLLVILPLISLVRDVLVWRSQKFIVTNRRVLHMSGVFSKNVTDSSLEKVNDVKMVQSALGRVFDYGDIEILTASELGVNRFARIARPIDLKTAMLNAKAELDHDDNGRSRSGAPDVPTLIARLGKLCEQGVLSEAEFAAKKAELLAKL